MKPLISVIIPTRNDSQWLSSTVRSILDNQQTENKLEIIIIDDASKKFIFDEIRDKDGRVEIKIIKLEKHVGVPQARNYGAKIAKGKILFITDSHVRFCKKWDQIILENINKNKIIAATIRDTNSSFRGYGCNLMIPFMGTRWNRKVPTSKLVQISSSAGTVIQKELFTKIGGYDSGMLWYGGAEPEFSVRAWLSDAKIITVPKLTIDHRFKQQNEITKFLKGLRPFMTHNNIRFGLLYLERNELLRMLRLHSMEFPDHIQQALKLIDKSNVWNRRKILKNKLEHDFQWFIKKFNLKDQVGNKIITG